ncbi:MAG TPA: 1-acyl-sn-glycerol-3-phosphate acyltransferase [Desulfobacterales bacterium]|nr:1-acyl-sn-glycerol-3-phosphate acyltransferase [Desulfobacterales bacterium]
MMKSLKAMWLKFKTNAMRGTNDAAQATHVHYICYLPKHFGFIASFLLKLFYSGIKINKDQIAVLRNIPNDAIVIYVNKHKSYFEYLFFHTRYSQLGLKCPEIGLNYRVYAWQPLSRLVKILWSHLNYLYHNLTLSDPYSSGYIRRELVAGRSAFLSLSEKKGFYRRFVKAKTDPIRYLIEMQEIINRPIYIIPQLMIFGKKPHRVAHTLIDLLLQPKENPGKIRRLITLFKNPEKILVEISEPVNLQNFLELERNPMSNVEHLALELRHQLIHQINRHRQSITGPILHSSEELKESILTNAELQNFMGRYSKKRGMPIHKVYRKAHAYLDEIAAKYNNVIIEIGAVVVGWFLKILFDGITFNHEILNQVKNTSKKGPLILIPCHKSHLDYLILSYILYTNNMPCPHVAAGKNLSFWPMGPLFRGGGAFFIRRTFRRAVLYSKVFSEYIQKLLEEGFNIEFFIEGGRSRTGKLILPKLGLLSILIDAYKKGACEDMIFVPTYVGYDRVLEESSYLNEIEGGQKKPESLLQVFRARKFLKKRYGRVYVMFHQPISFKDLLSQNDYDLSGMTPKEQNALCRNLGHRFINAINKVSVINPHSLVASAILNGSKKRFSYDQLKFRIETYMNYLNSQEVKLADTLFFDQDHAIENALDSYVQRKFIEPISKNQEGLSANSIYRVNESKRPLLEYYKNNCIALFIPSAFTALSILQKDVFQFAASDLFSSYAFLQEFFKYEFAYDIDRTPEYFVRKTVKSFINDAILIPHPTLPDTYNVTSLGYRKLKLFSSFLKTYFESYWIVLNFLMKQPKNPINKKERLKKIQAKGARMYKNREIDRNESLSKINYENAMEFFNTHEVKSLEDTAPIHFYADAIKRYMSHMP